MPQKTDFEDSIKEIKALFDKAELAIKKVESYVGLSFPAVNQLRYAGRHFIDSADLGSDEDRDEQLRRAKRHCQRAIYDAMDIGIDFCVSKIELFKSDYRKVTVTDIIPSYIEIIQKTEEAHNFIEQARTDSDCRENYYVEAEEHYDVLRGFLPLLDIARQELNKKLNKQFKQSAVQNCLLVVAILTLVVTLVGMNKGGVSDIEPAAGHIEAGIFPKF